MADKASNLISAFVTHKATLTDLENFHLQKLQKAKKLPVKQASLADASIGDVQIWFGIMLDTTNLDLEHIQPIKMPDALGNLNEPALLKPYEGLTGYYPEYARTWYLERSKYPHYLPRLDSLLISIHMHTERTWGVEVKRSKLEGEFLLTGRPDYAFWYGPVEEIELNVVIVEAKAEEKPG